MAGPRPDAQYWRDFESLETWSRSTLPHQKWWKDFLRDPAGTGFWHETYFRRGGFEAIYDDVPVPVGMMHFAPNQPARGPMFSARQRLQKAGEAQAGPRSGNLKLADLHPVMHSEDKIARHYTHGSLLPAILDALRAAGINPEHPSSDDLAPVDEFHIGSRAATVEFAQELGVAPGMRLLDIGSGIGGPARYFAAHRGCFVAGVDLSAEYCETARELSLRTGLADRTEFRHASAASLPWEAAAFDGAFMLHVGMNIAAKAEVFGEISRVLKPGAVFGIFDIMREAEGDLKFPVPWAAGPETSFVETAAVYAGLLRDAGFEVVRQRSRRDFALAFFAKMRESMSAAAASGGPPRLGLPIVMGPTAPVKLGNLGGMVERGTLAPVEMISRKR